MTRPLILVAVLAATALVSACSDAAPQAGAAPALAAPAFGSGLWRVSIGDAETGDRIDACLRDPAEMRALFERNLGDASICKSDGGSIGGGRIAVAFTCAADGVATRAVTNARYDALRIEGQTTITVQAQGETAHTLTAPVRGERIGDCPAKDGGK